MLYAHRQIQSVRVTASQRSDAIGNEFDRIYIFYGPRCFRLQNGQLAAKLDKKA
jgi:hypothetical protein